jgi:flagellar biosynthetic protein FlhB
MGMVTRIAVGVVGFAIVVAGADVFWQRFQWRKNLRMTKQEVKDEMKNDDGNPEIKAKIKQLRVQRAMNRMMAAVPNATVVVTNPTHYAVAIQFDPQTMPTPKVVAKGMDAIALKIREIAADNGVLVLENPPLARLLHKEVEIDEMIRPAHYKAVAEVIAYVNRIKAGIRT